MIESAWEQLEWKACDGLKMFNVDKFRSKQKVYVKNDKASTKCSLQHSN